MKLTARFALLSLLTFAAHTAIPARAAELQELSALNATNGTLHVDMRFKQGRVQVGDAPAVHGVVMEACRRGLTTRCAEGYAGMILHLEPKDHLRLHVKDELAHAGTPGGMDHCMDESRWDNTQGWQARDGKVNLHTHGLLVRANKVVSGDTTTYGDYVFDCAGSRAGKHVRGRHINYEIDLARGTGPTALPQPLGMNWFHPHVHGIAKPQVSLGLAGMITVGDPKSYLCLVPGADGKSCDQPASNAAFAKLKVRHMLLKDAQLIKQQGGASWYNWADQEPDFCGPNKIAVDNDGHCIIDPNIKATLVPDHVVTEGRWAFTLNGQEYPDITVKPQGAELWRIQNASANISYRLSLRKMGEALDPNGHRMRFHVLNMDGAGIAPKSLSDSGDLFAAGLAKEVLLMPGSRVELLVQYRADDDGCSSAVCPAADAKYQFFTEAFQAGFAEDDADIWPRIALAKVNFQAARAGVAAALLDPRLTAPQSIAVQQSAPSRETLKRLVKDNCLLPGNPDAALEDEIAGKVADNLRLRNTPATGTQRRRVYFGISVEGDAEDFVIGNTIVSDHGPGQAETEIDLAGNPITPENPVQLATVDMMTMKTNLCVLKNAEEVWELVNVSREVHNFHIHQSKFQVLRKPDGLPDMQTPSDLDKQILPEELLFKAGGKELMHDTIVVPRGVSACGESLARQDGKILLKPTTADSGQPCDDSKRGKIKIAIDFKGPHLSAPDNEHQTKFVYHCHILEHEDKGMMASITVIDPKDQ